MCLLTISTINSQVLNQSANWPNTNWTLTGTYDSGALLADPTLDSNFSYDDDAAGGGSTDILIATSPSIDLSSAYNAGETLISLSYEYNHNAVYSLNLEWYDADTATWNLLNTLPDNSSSLSNWCASTVSSTSETLDISSFTTTQQQGFQYRINNDSSSGWGWGFCINSPVITSAAPPSCEDASATMSAITATGATATWAAANGAASYDWEVVPTGSAQGVGVVASGSGETGLSVSITGLTSNTAYDFLISSDCTTDYASAVSFTTICDTITSFALDFDSSTNIPDCTSIDVSNILLGGLSIETVQSVSGTNSLRHRSYYLGDSSDFISQYLSTLGSNYRLNLSYWNNSNSDATLSVGTSDEAGNFTLFEDVTITETFQWVSLSVDFSAYTGTDTRITLRNTTNADGGGQFYVDYYMDDIVWEAIPSCLAVSDITYTSADTDGTSSLVSWTENGTATNYNIEVYAAGADTSTATPVYTETVVGATNATVTGLTADTNYDAYVQADCGFSGTAAFVMQQIYTGYCDPSTTATNVVFINDVTTTGGATDISNTGTGYDGYGDYRAQSITGVYGSQSFDISVTYDGQYGGRTHYWVDWNNDLEFDNTAGSSEFIGTSANGLSGTITVTIPADQAAGDYVLRVRLFNDTAAAADPCADITAGETEDYTISVIETPDCLVPDTLTSANITGTTADLSWNETGTANSHVVYVYNAGADPASATPAYTDTVSGTTTDTATGLTGNTTYDFYIAAVCPSGLGTTLSDLQNVPGTFTTSCEAITTPYTEDFETFTPATDTAFLVENCWLGTDSTFYWEMAAGTDTGSGTTGPSPTITTGNYFYTEASGGAEGDIAELSTTINLAGLTNPELTFDYHMYGATTGTLDVIVGGTNVFTLTGQQQTSETADWITAIVDLSAYSGEISVIFRATRGSSWSGDISLDNVSFAEAPSCIAPTSLSASAQQTSVDLAWIAGDTETIWDIELVDVTAGGSATGTPTTEDITTNPYTLSGLTSSNDYDVYLRADCSGDNSETSDWLSVSFTTLLGCGDTVTFCYDSGNNSLVKQSELESSGNYITATVNSGSTEEDYDELVVYDSLDTSGAVLYDQSGDHTGESFVSTTGFISVWVRADSSVSCVSGSESQISMTYTCAAPPACTNVTDITQVQPTTTSATISWLDSVNSTVDGGYDYELLDITAGQVAGEGITGNSTTLSLELTGLTGSHNDYTINLTTVCNASSSSSGTSFSWIQDPVLGYDCSTPITVLEGVNSAVFSAEGEGSIWYEYDAPADYGGTLSISACITGTDTILQMYDDCDTYNDGSDDYCGLGSGLIDVPVARSQSYKFEWLDNWDNSDFDFEFIFTPTPGSVCTAAIEAQVGTNTTNYTTSAGYNTDFADEVVHFSYTPVSDGVMTISSCDASTDTVFYIADGCGNYIADSDDDCGLQSTLTLSVTASQELKIYWAGWYDQDTFDWTLEYAASGSWTGATSTDWSESSNWATGALPSSSNDITIGTGLTNYPIIGSSTDANINNITVSSGASLTIDETSSLTVSGDFTNTGTVTLNSTADDYSSLIVTGTASGDIVYNRYVNVYDDTAGGGWDLVCSPVGMSIADFITANGSNIQVLGDNYAFSQFNNATGQWERYATASQTGNFEAGKGYSMATTGGSTVAFTGAMQTADQSINIINNNGLNNVGRRWNLVSNPFPSYILGNTAAGTNNFMDANSAVIDSEFLAVYGWNGSSYTIYNQLSGAFSMAPGQGFWVAALNTTDTALNFTAAMRTTTGTGDFVSSPQLLTYNVAVKLYNGEIEKATTDFYFRDGLSLDLDPGYDAAAFNQSMALSTRLPQGSQETAFGINAMGMDAMQNTRVPLEIRQNAGQAFRVSIADMELPEDIYVYLEDTLNGTLTSLKDGDFELVAQSNLSGSDRFFIVFKSNSVLSNGDTLGINALNVYKANTDSFVTIAGISPELGKLNVSLYNILGQTVREKALSSSTATQRVSTQGLASGLYIVQIRSGNQTTVKKIIVK
ncbi:GEVED domain-containing protein [Ulvibacter sp.]|nr:GEVED domain-containing protein [Ulvibacter sp.]